MKEPHKRIAYKRGATEIKQHPFFDGVNWALIRSATPPIIPETVDFSQYLSKQSVAATPADKKMAEIVSEQNTTTNAEQPDSYEDFEYF